MTCLGKCAECGGDVMLVFFDVENGCRFCVGCGRRGPDVVLETEAGRVLGDEEEPTLVVLAPEDVTIIGEPDPWLVAMTRCDR